MIQEKLVRQCIVDAMRVGGGNRQLKGVHLVKTDLLPLRLTSVYRAEAMVASGVRPWHFMCCRSSTSLAASASFQHLLQPMPLKSPTMDLWLPGWR